MCYEKFHRIDVLGVCGPPERRGALEVRANLGQPVFPVPEMRPESEIRIRPRRQKRSNHVHVLGRLLVVRSRLGIVRLGRPMRVQHGKKRIGPICRRRKVWVGAALDELQSKIKLAVERCHEQGTRLVAPTHLIDVRSAIEEGVRRVMAEGAIAGYPLQNIKVAVYDGKHHAVDSKEVAFVAAGRRAFIDAVQKASPVLLEPFVKLEITIPASYIGDISSDLSGRRGRIQGTDMLAGNQAVVQAEAPLSEVMTYANQLKSITGGAGSYIMEYSHDEKTPPNVQSQVIAAFSPEQHDE